MSFSSSVRSSTGWLTSGVPGGRSASKSVISSSTITSFPIKSSAVISASGLLNSASFCCKYANNLGASVSN